jgi:hypothetical protein
VEIVISKQKCGNTLPNPIAFWRIFSINREFSTEYFILRKKFTIWQFFAKEKISGLDFSN